MERKITFLPSVFRYLVKNGHQWFQCQTSTNQFWHLVTTFVTHGILWQPNKGRVLNRQNILKVHLSLAPRYSVIWMTEYIHINYCFNKKGTGCVQRLDTWHDLNVNKGHMSWISALHLKPQAFRAVCLLNPEFKYGHALALLEFASLDLSLHFTQLAARITTVW